MIFDFFRKRKTVTPYDRQTQLPIIKSSVCTGEKTACFQDLRTKKITEIMLIRDDRDLAEFCRRYDVNPSDIKYIYP